MAVSIDNAKLYIATTSISPAMLKKWAHVNIRIGSPDERKKLDLLEVEFHDEGIEFDTGWNLVDGSRDWILDRTLEGPLSPGQIIARARRTGLKLEVTWKKAVIPNVAAEVKSMIGDVVSLPLDGKGNRGYGRVLIERRPLIFVEFYKFLAKDDPPVDTFARTEWILRIYTGNMGIMTGAWRILGNLPINHGLSMPLFWLKDPLTEKLLLFTDPIHQREHRETTTEEIERLGAQPGAVYGHSAAQAVLAAELKKFGLLPS